MKHKIIIFDLYGTLLESQASWFLYESLLKSLDYTTTEHNAMARFKRVALTRNHKKLINLLDDLHLSYEGHEDVVESHQHTLNTQVKNIKMKEYSESILTRLHEKKTPMYLLSNATHPYAEAFNFTPTRGLFTAAMYSCFAGYQKPEPEIFLKLVSNYDLKINECIMIGDSRAADIIGANSIGMNARLTKGGYDLIRVLKDEGFLTSGDISIIKK